MPASYAVVRMPAARAVVRMPASYAVRIPGAGRRAAGGRLAPERRRGSPGARASVARRVARRSAPRGSSRRGFVERAARFGLGGVKVIRGRRERRRRRRLGRAKAETGRDAVPGGGMVVSPGCYRPRGDRDGGPLAAAAAAAAAAAPRGSVPFRRERRALRRLGFEKVRDASLVRLALLFPVFPHRVLLRLLDDLHVLERLRVALPLEHRLLLPPELLHLRGRDARLRLQALEPRAEVVELLPVPLSHLRLLVRASRRLRRDRGGRGGTGGGRGGVGGHRRRARARGRVRRAPVRRARVRGVHHRRRRSDASAEGPSGPSSARAARGDAGSADEPDERGESRPEAPPRDAAGHGARARRSARRSVCLGRVDDERASERRWRFDDDERSR